MSEEKQPYRKDGRMMEKIQNAQLPWYKRIRRWGQTNLTENDPSEDHLDFWKVQWKRTKVHRIDDFEVLVLCPEEKEESAS